MNYNFSNKTSLVTGGSRGIGKQIALDLNKMGSKVYIISRNIPDWDLPDGITHVKLDLSNIFDVNKFINGWLKIYKIDILINNAGINIIKNIKNVTEMDYDRIHNINLKVPYLFSKNSNINKGGKIVNISSIWGVISKKDRTLYSTMKSGILGMTKSTSLDYSPDILVNSISPGFTKTELTEKSLTNGEIKDLEKQIPMGRMATVEEISQSVLFLCSDSNTYITGQNVIIDGGFTII